MMQRAGAIITPSPSETLLNLAANLGSYGQELPSLFTEGKIVGASRTF